MAPEVHTSHRGPRDAAKSIAIDESPADDAWDAYVEASSAASVFHGTAWRRAIDQSFGYRPFHRLARRGSKVCGVLPLYQVSSPPFGRSLISTPFAVHGGICADDDETAGALLEDAAVLARRLGCRYVELRHERPIADLPTKDLYVTFRRAILPDREANLAAIPSNKRHRVRNSEKRGLTVRLGGAELLPSYYRVISESMRNLGSPVFPERLFRALLEEFGARCRIFSVFHDETMVAGALTLFYRDQVIPYYGGSTRTGNSLAANDFMYWKLICHGAEAGYKIFDFGRSKKESGAYGFKRHWGFEPTPLAYQYQLTGQRDLPNLSPANPKFSLAIHLWRRMPLRLTQWLGPQLVRYFP